MNRALLAVLFIISALCYGVTHASDAIIPLEHFANKPDVSDLSLSPDGEKLASLVRVDIPDIKGTALSIYDLNTGKTTYPLMAKDEVHFIRWISWANNETVLVGTMLPVLRAQNNVTRRMKTRETRSLSVNVITGVVQPIISDKYIKKLEVKPFDQDNIIDILPDDPEHVLMAITGNISGTWGSTRSLPPSVLKINLKNQRSRRVQKPLNDVYRFATDRQHRVRIAYEYDERNMEYSILIKNLKNKKWEERWRFPSLSDEAVWPIGFDHDPNILFVNSYHEDRYAIFKVDLSNKEENRELILSDSRYDLFGRLYYSAQLKRAVGIRSNSEENGILFWDKGYNALQNGINKALPNTSNIIYELSEDERKYIVLAQNHLDSGTYYLGDRDKGTLDKVAYRHKHLPPELMATRQTITYQARDGLEIEGVLTLPKGKEAKNLPTIMYPHGGPIARTYKGFDPYAQFLASRGYAVLQMNFRGSAGYGYSFMAAGFKGWGKEMQDDIEDGAKTLVERGITDPDKICILGESYGGYAALMGTVKTPNFYQCAISFAGVTNVEKLAERFRGRFKSSASIQLGTNDKELRQISPVHHADKITVPVLLLHGDKDRQVRPFHSEDMYKALKKHNKDVEYIVLDEGNHYLTNNEHRLIYFRALESFLKEHLN